MKDVAWSGGTEGQRDREMTVFGNDQYALLLPHLPIMCSIINTIVSKIHKISSIQLSCLFCRQPRCVTGNVRYCSSLLSSEWNKESRFFCDSKYRLLHNLLRGREMHGSWASIADTFGLAFLSCFYRCRYSGVSCLFCTEFNRFQSTHGLSELWGRTTWQFSH